MQKHNLGDSQIKKYFFVKCVFSLLFVTAIAHSYQLSEFAITAKASSLSSVVASPKFMQVDYGTGNWDNKVYGNHRAVVFVAGKPKTARVIIPWHRRDEYPERKQIIVISKNTGQTINNVLAVNINQAFGEIIFEPDYVNGYYYIYYMPYRYENPMYNPTTLYLSPQKTADATWIKQNHLKNLSEDFLEKMSCGIIEEIQAINEFNAFYPMEVKASPEEVASLVQVHKDEDFLVFCEDRQNSIRMQDAIPLKWVQSGPVTVHNGLALKDEFYVLQVGVFAHTQDLKNIKLTFPDLRSPNSTIPATNFTCFNTEGVDVSGKAFKKTVNVQKGSVQPLWIGLQIPEDAQKGRYHGTIKISADDKKAAKVDIWMEVKDEKIKNHGDDDLWRLSKLRWLNSTIGQGDHVVKPFKAIELIGPRKVKLLGRSVELGEMGLPSQINSYFADTLDRFQQQPIPLLSDEISFDIEVNSKKLRIKPNNFSLLETAKTYAVFMGTSSKENLEQEVYITVENDGWVDCRINLKVLKDMTIDDMYLTVPFHKEVAKYMMGLGFRGGKRPEQWSWKWPDKQFNHLVWVGDINAGMRIRLDYPFNYWSLSAYAPSGRPSAWYNNGKGGCELYEKEDSFVFKAYSGSRTIKKGDEIKFRFSLLITPFKPINYDHWNWRYCHGWKDLWPVDKVLENGAKIVNIHQGNQIIPHINYVFTTASHIKNYVDNARKMGLERIKIYYTVRELSNHLPELWAFRSLGDEIYISGQGFRLADHFDKDLPNRPQNRTGNSWLCEHLIGNYASAWHDRLDGQWDAAIATQGISRLHNFYLEGLSWMIKEVGIDGLYLDGIGYDRHTTRRLRTVMDNARPCCLLDFHSGNNYLPKYGLNNPANLYMEHFPYLDSLWFGEGFDYSSEPDYYLVEISGLPFGLFGEMLRGGGNPWRGMIYGMSNRLRWQGNPKPIWALWDLFGIEDSRMIGYWSKELPIKTNKDDILSTVYLKDDSALIILASWAENVEYCNLEINWEKLGFDQKNYILYGPKVGDLQEEVWFKPDSTIPVVPEQGWFLILRPQKPNEDIKLISNQKRENKE